MALAFAEALGRLERRIEAFLALPVERLDAIAIKRHLDEIGAGRGPEA